MVVFINKNNNNNKGRQIAAFRGRLTMEATSSTQLIALSELTSDFKTKICQKKKSKLCSAKRLLTQKQYTVAIRKKTAEKKSANKWFTADKSADSTALCTRLYAKKKLVTIWRKKKQNTKDNYKILVEDLSSETKQNWKKEKKVQLTLLHFTLVVFTNFSFIIWC